MSLWSSGTLVGRRGLRLGVMVSPGTALGGPLALFVAWVAGSWVRGPWFALFERGIRAWGPLVMVWGPLVRALGPSVRGVLGLGTQFLLSGYLFWLREGCLACLSGRVSRGGLCTRPSLEQNAQHFVL